MPAALVLLLLASQQPAAAPRDLPPPHDAAISGRVTERGSGRPLPRIVVTLTRTGRSTPLDTITDDDGRYEITGVEPGEYALSAGPDRHRSTHLHQHYGSDTPGPPEVEPPPPNLRLTAGERRSGVDIALWRALAIEGRVVDPCRVVDPWDNGMANVSVLVKRVGERVRPAGGAFGRCVRPAPRPRPALMGDRCAEVHRGVLPRPGPRSLIRRTRCIAQARARTRAVGRDRSDVGEIEIRMRRGRTFTIAGRIVDASGASAAGAHLLLAQHRPGGSRALSYKVDAEGRFRITAVHPGEYVLEAWIGGSDHPEQRRRLERALVPIRLDAADVSDVSVALQRTVDVVGRVTLEDSTAPFVRAPGYGPMSVMSALVGYTGPDSRLSPVDDNRSFTIKAVFGPRTLDVVNLPRGWYVRSIHYAGRDIIDEPTTFKDSGGESAIEIVLSNRGAVVVGRATDESGNAVGRAVILMFPADAARISWRLPAETRTSPAGQFRAGPVRPGEYCIVALPASARRPIQPGGSARLARLAAAAERITLSELEERTVDLRVVAER